MATGTVTVGSSTYYGIATYTDINNIASNSTSNAFASAGSSVAKKCVTYENLANTPLALLYNVAGTYDAKKCVKSANITKKVTIGISISPSSMSFTAGGGTKNAAVSISGATLTSLSIASVPNWVTASASAGTVLVTAYTNASSPSARSGNVSVTANTTGGSVTGSIRVSQEGGKSVSSITLNVSQTITFGAFVGYSATVTYSDGSTASLSVCSVSVSNSAVISTHKTGSTGYLFGQGVGYADLTVSCGGKTTTKRITVQGNSSTSSVLKIVTSSALNSVTFTGACQMYFRYGTSGTGVLKTIPGGGITMNPQVGVITNNFSGTGSYITSSSMYSSTYARILFYGMPAGTYTLRDYDTYANGVTATVSSGTLDFGYQLLTKWNVYTVYNEGRSIKAIHSSNVGKGLVLVLYKN